MLPAAQHRCSGCLIDWNAGDRGAELYAGHHGLWADVPAVPLYRNFPGAFGCICRRTQPKHWHEFSQILCRSVPGGRCDCPVLCVYSAYAAARPDVSADSSAAMQVLTYIGELTFNMLGLVGLMKGANQVTWEMLGL